MNSPFFKSIEQWVQVAPDVLRRAIDGTVKPLFVDNTNFRVGIQATSLNSNSSLTVSGGITLSATGTADDTVPTKAYVDSALTATGDTIARMLALLT